MRVLSSPPLSAAMLFTVGGNWQWSPASITREVRRMAIQHAASRACAASSMKRVLNFWPCINRLLDPTRVEAMTRASLKSSLLMRSSSSVARLFSLSSF
ncbi:hypothetical protein EVA_10981 [gut metagenome]|uniref:Uncharacterized protein n=1 Tax=gut metagenome TaxID=749906 RepID=J9G0Z5_9ZZZZ